MIKLYQDKKWLKKKYIDEESSSPQIAKLEKVNSQTINNWRKKFNIITRSRGERQHLATGNHCNLSQEALEWINGELLGDACVQSYSSYSAQFCYTSKFPDYINYVSETLKSFGINQTGKIYLLITKFKQYGPSYTAFTYSSLKYAELLPIRKKWYPRGKKIVPRDLKLTPITCRQWYIGDGCLSSSKNFRPYIYLCTQGFTISDVEYLIKKLIKLGFKVTRQLYKNIIHISVHSVKDFLNYIGPCPVKRYQYKWNIRNNLGGGS